MKRNRKKGDKKKKTSTASVTQADTGNNDDAAAKDFGSDGEDARKSETPTPEVDDEGGVGHLVAVAAVFGLTCLMSASS